jgi:hypothetical protein
MLPQERVDAVPHEDGAGVEDAEASMDLRPWKFTADHGLSDPCRSVKSAA